MAPWAYAEDLASPPAAMKTAIGFYDSNLSRIQVHHTARRGSLLIKYQSGLESLRESYREQGLLDEVQSSIRELSRLNESWTMDADDIVDSPAALNLAQTKLLQSLSEVQRDEQLERFEFQCDFLYKLQVMRIRFSASGDTTSLGHVDTALRHYRKQIGAVPGQASLPYLLSQNPVP